LTTTSLADQGAVLGAADVERIGQRGQFRKRQVVAGRGERSAETGAVHVQQQAMLAAKRRQRGQLRARIDRAQLGACETYTNRGCTRCSLACSASTGTIASGVSLPSVAGTVITLWPVALDGAGFVGGDVAGDGGDGGLVRAQEGGQRDQTVPPTSRCTSAAACAQALRIRAMARSVCASNP
jgi:hypothetical protein